MSSILYCYGTLRPGNANVVQVPGLLYDLGWYPGLVQLGSDSGLVTAERMLVEDWAKVDAYEGFNPRDVNNSLYVRTPF